MKPPMPVEANRRAIALRADNAAEREKFALDLQRVLRERFPSCREQLPGGVHHLGNQLQTAINLKNIFGCWAAVPTREGQHSTPACGLSLG